MNQMLDGVEELARAISLFPWINIAVTAKKLQNRHPVLEVVDELRLFIYTAVMVERL